MVLSEVVYENTEIWNESKSVTAGRKRGDRNGSGAGAGQQITSTIAKDLTRCDRKFTLE